MAPVKSAILIDYNQFNYLIIRYLLADAKIYDPYTFESLAGQKNVLYDCSSNSSYI